MFANFLRIRERIKEYFSRAFGYKRVEIEVDETLNNVFSAESKRQKIERIYQIQQENNRKLQEMNDKIANTLRRIEEVKKKMVNARMKEIENKISPNRKKDQPDVIIPKHISRQPFREFSEFVDLHEFIKFNRMGRISDEEINNCNWNDTFKKLCKIL